MSIFVSAAQASVVSTFPFPAASTLLIRWATEIPTLNYAAHYSSRRVRPSSRGREMNKMKAIGGCLGTFLLSALGVGLVGWIITTIFPKSYTVVSAIGGLIVIIALWNAIATFVKILKQKGEAAPSPESKPTNPGASGQ